MRKPYGHSARVGEARQRRSAWQAGGVRRCTTGLALVVTVMAGLLAAVRLRRPPARTRPR